MLFFAHSLTRGIDPDPEGNDPDGPQPPQSIREAVAWFFEDRRQGSAGLISHWTNQERREVAQNITVAATGAKSRQGNPCFTIADKGEGQTPIELPKTILSLDRGNKDAIPFVQGKFNMGGSGALEFCGRTHNLQLVVSRRNPTLVNKPEESLWGFTIVRREDPSSDRKSSVYTYLAPLDSDTHPRKGEVLRFSSDTLPIFPDGSEAYARESEWGTLIKLYEYAATGFKSHVLMRKGLLRRAEVLLPEVALPIRIYECRKLGGQTHGGSPDTTLTGLKVRMDDNKKGNLEEDPESFVINVDGQELTGAIYAFKKDKARSYRANEGMIFTVNGQTHGNEKTDFFRGVGLDSLRKDLLVMVNCSKLSKRSREQLFMNSRDRLRQGILRDKILSELKVMLRNEQKITYKAFG